MKNRISKLITLASEGIWEKEHIFSLALLCSIAGESIFLLGPPGTAKSVIARRLKEIFKEKKAFEYLMSRFSTPDEIFGPVSISKLKDEDVYERRTEGYLPSATVVFLDEIWKAGPAIQNSLLTVINEKIYQNGNHTIKLPMKALIAASNELPQEDEGLEALWDRFIVRIVSNCISNEKIFYKMLRQKREAAITIPDSLTISDKEYLDWQEQICEIDIPDEILKTITIIREKLKEIEKKEEREPLDFYISDRRWKKIIHLLQTSAFLNGRKIIKHTDLSILNHVLWNKAEFISTISTVVSQSLFADLQERIEKLEKEIDSVFKSMLPSTDLNSGTNFKIYKFFYYKLMNYPDEDCYVFMSDYKHIDKARYTDGLMYWDNVSKGRIIRVLDISQPFAASQVSAEKVRKVKLRKTIDGIEVDSKPYKLETEIGNIYQTLPIQDNKELIDSLFDSISFIKSDLSERTESMCKQKNLFISPNEAKTLKKEASALEKDIHRLETKTMGMFKPST